MKQLVRSAARRLGVDVVRYTPVADRVPRDARPPDRHILQRIAGFTMTSPDRQLALIQATRHLVQQRIAGCFVECGVWRGGSAMAMALTLMQEGAEDRSLYLFDTFSGMSEPQAVDRRRDGTPAQQLMAADPGRGNEVWAVAALDDVRANLRSTGYPDRHLHCIVGAVEDTLPAAAPDEPIALLRLDTDWYASTRHELQHLYPLLVPGGMLVIDDYGDWEGARRAVDEFLASLPPPRPFLHRIDDTGRLLIKPPARPNEPPSRPD